jgi:hypothetical protein
MEDSMNHLRIALNVADMTREPMAAGLLIGPVTPGRILVNANPKVFDEGAIVLECDEERARAIAQILRDQDDRKRRPYRTRVYFERPKGGWRKATGTEVLS